MSIRIKYMVDRFLGWRLPADFNPDGGISFERVRNPGQPYAFINEPVGTNLFTAMQAEAMIRYMLDGTLADEIPDELPPEPKAKKDGPLMFDDLLHPAASCPYCSNKHNGICHRIKAVKLSDWGAVTNIEFFSMAEMNPPYVLPGGQPITIR